VTLQVPDVHVQPSVAVPAWQFVLLSLLAAVQ
jgi:hypothetical protein